MPELIDNYNIYLYSGRNDNDELDTKDYLPFTNDYSNVMQFNTKADRDRYFSAIPHYTVEQTDDYKVYLDGGTIKLAFGIGLNIDCDFENIRYMRIDTLWGIQQPPPGVAPEGYVLSAKYYFVNSYEIVSSYNGVTVVVFNIEYDYWMNNQFDFEIRESNVERSHVDRWDSDGNIIYRKPVMDSIDSFVKVERKQTIPSQQVKIWDSDGINYKDVLWCVVTASHTLGSFPDQILYHFFPVKYKKDDLNTDNVSYTQSAFYTQNSCKAFTRNGRTAYYPSLQCLDNAILMYACGHGTERDGETDSVQIINIQLFNYMPISMDTVEIDGISTLVPFFNTNKHMDIVGGTYSIISTNDLFVTGVLPDLTILMKGSMQSSNIMQQLIKPVKPTDGVETNARFEPALYLNPIRSRKIISEDNTAISEINDELYIMMCNSNNNFVIHQNVSFSATSSYNYITFNDFDRSTLNLLGFAFNKISYIYDFMSEEWAKYCVTQRDSDRMMMLTNIATSGIAEGGSTGVSAGIGYRANMERAIATQNDIGYANEMSKYYGTAQAFSPDLRHRYESQNKYLNIPNSEMYKKMSKSAMMMSGVGGITAFSSNAIHQGMAQRAKEKSIKNTPSGLATAGNSTNAIMSEQIETSFVEMIVDTSSYILYRNIFMKYGYYIGYVIKPDIYSRKYFNYIKTNGAILTGKVNNMILSALANILDSGVTIWHMDYCVTYTTVDNVEKVDYLSMYEYEYENIERRLM